MDITVVLASVVVFMVIVFLLVGMLLGVKAKLLPSGPVKLMINGSQDVEVGSGSTLLTTLGNNKIFYHQLVVEEGLAFSVNALSKKVVVRYFPQRTTHFTRKEIAEGWRLGCQVKVKQDMGYRST